MGKHDGSVESVKIEAGQILDPDRFPQPNELVCIQVPKVFDQVALRDCITRTVTLGRCDGSVSSNFAFEGANNFDIVEVRVISKADSVLRPGFKKIKLAVKVRYTIFFSNGDEQCSQQDEAVFNFTINEIYCPSCLTQIGVIKFPKDENCGKFVDEDGLILKVEALIEAFNDEISGNVLSLDLGIFAIIKCECIVQLLIPSFGYCPVPPEQPNAAIQTCRTFNDRERTPFPNKFFPDQKWNPLDKANREER